MGNSKIYSGQQSGAQHKQATLSLGTLSTRRARTFIAAAIAVVAALSIAAGLSVRTGSAAGTAGVLDTTFNRTGKVVANFSGNNDEAHAIAVQPDGKLVIVGSSFANNKVLIDFALVRVNTDGSLDKKFGNNGLVTTDFFQNSDSAAAVAIQADGRIVVAGSAQLGANMPRVFALARYNSNGSIDSTFGSGGKVTTAFGGTLAGVNAVSLQKDGKIVVAGTVDFNPSVPGGSLDFAVARYNSNGALDAGFANGGKAISDFFGSSDIVNGMVIQPDGNIVVVGSAFNPSADSASFALARYDNSGALDGSFGGSGQVTTNFAGASEADAVALRSDGKIIVAGTVADPITNSNGFGLARYDADGTLDNTFGSGGESAVPMPLGGGGEASGVALQADNKILVVGTAAAANLSLDFALVRYNDDGSFDTDYGNGGEVTTDFLSGTDTASAVAVQSNGNAVAVGRAFNRGSYDFALVCYQSGNVVQPPPPTPAPTPAPTPVPTPTPAPEAAPTIVSLVLNPSSVPITTSSSATITLSGVATGNGVTVALTTTDSRRASVPSTVIVQPGDFSVTFPVPTSKTGTATITATMPNGVKKTATLTVT
jgi:uncharacterized delta-60 repeat protein